MAQLLLVGEAAAQKGCSKKSVRRACEQGKLNSEYDPVTGQYLVCPDQKWDEWEPGPKG